MRTPTRLLICAVALGLLSGSSQAVIIGPYPGLDALIQEADTIAIIRVDSSTSSMINGWLKPDCYVYQTLKGDLKANTHLPISLNSFVSAKPSIDGAAFAPMTTHLVFLNASKEPINGANYSIIGREGADLPLSPLGNESKPAGKTLKEQIQTLLLRYKTYRDEQTKREDRLLDKALAE